MNDHEPDTEGEQVIGCCGFVLITIGVFILLPVGWALFFVGCLMLSLAAFFTACKHRK